MLNTLRFAWQGLLRDWRSGELTIVAIAIVIAVASLTTVGFFTDRIERAIEQSATELLAADLVLSSSAPVPDEYHLQADQQQLTATRLVTFRSVVMHNDHFQMSEVKAVEAGYPLRGSMRTADALFADEQLATSVPNRGELWVDARLLQLLGVAIGETIQLGSATFRVSKILTYEPDRGGDMFNIAPRLLMNLADLDSTGLILPGSRVRHRLLLSGEPAAVSAYRDWFDDQVNTSVKLRGIRDARPELKTALERANQFLGLAALVSVALAGLAIAMSTQRYVARHFDHCAILRCIGLTRRTVFMIYVIQVLLLALIGSTVGTVIGYVCQSGLAELMSGLVQNQLPPPSSWPILSGVITGIVTACGFAIPQLARLNLVSPMRVLRRDLQPLAVSGWVVYLFAVLALAALLPWQSGELSLSLYSLLGLILTSVLLVLTAWLCLRGLRKINAQGAALSYGLSNLPRRGSRSVAQIVGIGLGMTVMLLLFVIRTDLLVEWRDRLPAGTPNYFLINIQPDEVSALSDYLFQQGKVLAEFYPMIRGRLVKLNDEPIDIESYPDERAQRLLSREFNLSFADHMQSHNKLVEGGWWQPGETDVFSVEQGIAETIGIKVGDQLTYNVAGSEVSGIVKNLRFVEWDSFNVNFFVMSDPQTLSDYPAAWITSFYLPSSDRKVLNEIVQRFPSVTVFDVDAILTQVRTLMERVIRTVEYVFLFTVLSGIVVLFAALQTTHDERRHESALLKALGAKHRIILHSLIIEFAVLGLIAGLLSALGASLVAALLAEFVFRMSFALNTSVFVIGPLVGVSIVIISGLLGTRRVLSTPPIAALRQV